jgi:uncharacterized protein (TIGR02118 family)
MYRLMVLYPQPQDPQHFREYYIAHHLPLAAQLPGLRSMRYSLDVAGLGEPSPYFGVWEGEFDSREAMEAALGSPVGRRVGEDTSNYATGGAHLVHFAVEANR